MNFKRIFPLILALLLVLGALTACGGKADGDLAALQASYPKAFGLDTAAGLQIAVWKIGSGTPLCFLLPGDAETVPLDTLNSAGLTVDDAKAVVAAYHLSADAVRLRPFHNPLSSYAYVLDDAYGNEIAALFDGAYAVGPAISLES